MMYHNKIIETIMKNIAVIGLGYVGLPLAIEFAKTNNVVGFDISKAKINAYLAGYDPANEVEPEQFKAAKHFTPTTDISKIADADFIIIAMPTPVDEHNIPDFTYLKIASIQVGSVMKQGTTVIYESTVYPGATEEICIPLLEQASGKTWKKDFFVGYSPERVIPGDKQHTVSKITKIVSGDTQATLENVASLYDEIITAGLYRASSIKVAEAAKVSENIQRDVNIAIINELAMVFNKLGIDTLEVLEAAGSKWNFIPYRPGLVGGHCIGVDPYYLIHRALEVGQEAKVMSSAREVNNSIPKFIVDSVVYGTPRVLVYGMTFKEDCKDIRNSKAADLIKEFGLKADDVVVCDPLADEAETMHEYGIQIIPFDQLPKHYFDIIVLAVPHKELLAKNPEELLSPGRPHCTFVDVKSKMDREVVAPLCGKVWRL
jgi:UDP-N-acetyl-D-galactosamine dehydrogenase